MAAMSLTYLTIRVPCVEGGGVAHEDEYSII